MLCNNVGFLSSLKLGSRAHLFRYIDCVYHRPVQLGSILDEGENTVTVTGRYSNMMTVTYKVRSSTRAKFIMLHVIWWSV